jgi:DNA-binding CsgD family transcriptional regulator
LSARISARLVLITVPGNPVRALQHAERAVGQVDGERDPLVLSSLLIDLCLLDLMLGRSPRTDLMRRGLALEECAGPSAYPHPVPLIWLQCTDDVEATRERHAREADWARDHSDETHAAERLGYLALVEFHAGRCDLAERLIERSCNTIEERLEVSGRFAYPFAWRSLMDAYRGRSDRARETLLPLVAETAHAQKSWWAAIFERLGAVVWAERARNELDVVGPRRRAPGELTATQLRVAELAAAGITNREIARAVFMSEKTVEAHITRVYRKLGIHSRAELGAWMAGNPASSQRRT